MASADEAFWYYHVITGGVATECRTIVTNDVNIVEKLTFNGLKYKDVTLLQLGLVFSSRLVFSQFLQVLLWSGHKLSAAYSETTSLWVDKYMHALWWAGGDLTDISIWIYRVVSACKRTLLLVVVTVVASWVWMWWCVDTLRLWSLSMRSRACLLVLRMCLEILAFSNSHVWLGSLRWKRPSWLLISVAWLSVEHLYLL